MDITDFQFNRFQLNNFIGNYFSQGQRSKEHRGYYERVPLRVDEYVICENSEGKVVYETTAREPCRNGAKITLTISSTSGWSANCRQGPHHWTIASSVELTTNRLERRRVFWHAGQFMAGRDTVDGTDFGDNFSFETDDFFENGDPITTDPFDEFLEN